MDMNIQDIHYNKYIKYKTKYLELKEQSAGTGMNVFRNGQKYYGNQYNKIKDKIKIFKTNFNESDIVLTKIIEQQNIKKRKINVEKRIIYIESELQKTWHERATKQDHIEMVQALNKIIKKLEKERENLLKELTDLKNKTIETPSIDDNIVIYQSQIIKNILSIEEYLLNILLPEFYENKDKIYDDNKIIYFLKIFMLICLIIINYREYLYLKKYYREHVYFNQDFENEEILRYYLTNNQNLFYDIFEYLNLFKISKFKKIKNILDIYFTYIRKSMIFLDSFTYTHIKKEYINNNIIIFEQTKILSDLIKSNDEYLYSLPTFPLTDRYHIENKTKILYLLKQNFNLKVLYTFKNNNFANNIDYIMMLINCYIININMFLIIHHGDGEKKFHDNIIDIYFKNLMITTRPNLGNLICHPVEMCGPPGESEQAWQGAPDEKIIENAKIALRGKQTLPTEIKRYNCINNTCEANILNIFKTFTDIFNTNNRNIIFKSNYYIKLNNELKEGIEKYFPNNNVFIELINYFNSIYRSYRS
jgi:hypothetical protein